MLYGLIRATILFFAVAAFIGIHAPNANYPAAFALLAIASLSFIGVGIMTSVLPLISPEKGAQLGFVAQGMMLVVSGVYYPVSVMPGWMQWIAKISPATYALRGCRASIIHGAGIAWADVWPLLIIAVLATPIGLGDLQPGRAVREEARKAEEGRLMATDWFAGEVAERYDADTAGMPVEPVVDFLLPFASGGALELAIGTGRIAVPLAARGVRVAGIDLSPDMVAELRKKTDAIPVAIGDMTTTRVDGDVLARYVVFNSINNVTTQDGQAAVFANAAAHLEPGGCVRRRGRRPRTRSGSRCST